MLFVLKVLKLFTKNMFFNTFSKPILLLLFFLSNYVNSKKVTSDLDTPGKFDECKRCKVLIDSFIHWLDKTSRGKYEGGDAAWEETKLKSYARSEIRLVEIQEGLCSELKWNQDHCYALAEEAEPVLERWWFAKDSSSVDLYTWLCTETLKYCCPENHYGLDCSPCPMDKDNQVCGGRGKCDGIGTRKGNGTCLCRRGYTGMNCQECEQTYFTNSAGNCEPCHKACKGCTHSGPAACSMCNAGWQLESGICVDINECINANICKTNQYCVNKDGTHICKNCDQSCKSCVGEGSLNCSMCDTTSVLWLGMCMNEKEKHDILMDSVKRLALYFGLLIIAYFIFRYSKALASIVILIIALYVYYSEKTSRIKIIDILVNSENTSSILHLSV